MTKDFLVFMFYIRKIFSSVKEYIEEEEEDHVLLFGAA
jgi:hypothetical protein